ncbi:MAG: penicillin-binding protein 2 [Gammaproteobacteria bacterium]|nr:penicillin-binding protein 2 [Gammaproteobacteria bacterium]
MSRRAKTRHPMRNAIVLLFFLGGLVLLSARAVYLQVLNSDFLQNQGNQRHSRLVKDNSHRGMILDRHGSPLAVSTPVDSVWAHPPTLAEERRKLPRLAALLEMTSRELTQLMRRHEGREFMYLKRHVPPPLAERVMALKISGVALQREYRRYYPLGSVAGHVIGFTNIDDQGQEGVELAYDASLRAVPGTKRLLRDLRGNAVEVAESVVLPKPGRDLMLSIDRRIQYLAYRELKAAVFEHGARAGSAVVLDARTGEVLALVNEPDFNPNNRTGLHSGMFRNRAVTDLFEPGSTLKPFTIACALESGKYSPGSVIDTTPGTLQVGDRTFHDVHNYGVLTVAGVIEKSSNVGISKIALSLNKKSMWEMLRHAGFGQSTGVQLPGEVSGLLNPYASWVPVDQASISFGYGISVTPLQLARAYLALANDGTALPLTLQHSETIPEGERIMSSKTARRLQSMLELAVSDAGTGKAAQVADYRVAGKTGTVRKLTPEGYSEDKYVAWFAGLAPINSPRLVMVITVDEPARGAYYGGEVAAPVFGHVMAGALRLLDIPPDAPRKETRLLTVKSERMTE